VRWQQRQSLPLPMTYRLRLNGDRCRGKSL